MTTKHLVAAGAVAVLVTVAGALWWMSASRSTHIILLPPVQEAGR